MYVPPAPRCLSLEFLCRKKAVKRHRHLNLISPHSSSRKAEDERTNDAMYIEEVCIDGFKSYAKRTVVPGFDPLFNAITGLNGSGKSNILDSICFVLGISNLTHVRTFDDDDEYDYYFLSLCIRIQRSVTRARSFVDSFPFHFVCWFLRGKSERERVGTVC